ncbi:hypothetical protein AAZX31_14G137000 [Glycine max]
MRRDLFISLSSLTFSVPSLCFQDPNPSSHPHPTYHHHTIFAPYLNQCQAQSPPTHNTITIRTTLCTTLDSRFACELDPLSLATTVPLQLHLCA